jgi:hypothetical protein
MKGIINKFRKNTSDIHTPDIMPKETYINKLNQLTKDYLSSGKKDCGTIPSGWNETFKKNCERIQIENVKIEKDNSEKYIKQINKINEYKGKMVDDNDYTNLLKELKSELDIPSQGGKRRTKRRRQRRSNKKRTNKRKKTKTRMKKRKTSKRKTNKRRRR